MKLLVLIRMDQKNLGCSMSSAALLCCRQCRRDEHSFTCRPLRHKDEDDDVLWAEENPNGSYYTGKQDIIAKIFVPELIGFVQCLWRWTSSPENLQNLNTSYYTGKQDCITEIFVLEIIGFDASVKMNLKSWTWKTPLWKAYFLKHNLFDNRCNESPDRLEHSV